MPKHYGTANYYDGDDTFRLPDAVLEAETVVVPEAKRLNCIDKAMFRCKQLKIWIKTNYMELLSIFLTVVVVVGVYTINVAFYIVAMVDPEKWSFLNTGVKEGFYTTWMVLWTLFGCFLFVQPAFERYNSRHKKRWVPWTITIVVGSFFVSMPFWLVHHYKHVAYHELCDDSIYELEIIGKGVYFENNHLYDIKSSIEGNSLTITTGPIPPNGETLTTVFDTINNVVSYNERLDLYNSTIRSKTNMWFKNRAEFDGIKYMSHPSDGELSKICMDTFGMDTLKITTIIPVLQNRAQTCHDCMEGCLAECKRWDTRMVPYTYSTCNSKGACTTHTGVRVETYCAEYMAYSECKGRCTNPACVGINL